MSERILELCDVYKWLGYGKKPQVVLKEINLKIYSKDIISVRGKSGSGKSTLLNILAGALTVDKGAVYFKGTDIYRISDKERAVYRKDVVGYIPQNLHLLMDWNVFDNIALPLRCLRVERSAIKTKVEEMAENLGIQGLLNKEIRDLSGGEKQRVAICRAIIKEPEILLADEPTSALDDENERAVMETFLKLNQKGTTIIISTHDSNVASICNREYLLCCEG